MWIRWSLGFALALALAACSGGGVPQRVSGPPPAQQAPASARLASPDPAPATVVVAPGDTVASLADRHRVSIRDLIDANRLEPPYELAPGRSLLIPAGRTHRVMRGETLYGISRYYRSDLATVAKLNRLGPPYRIYDGQSLRIPAAGPSPIPVTVAAAEPPPAPPGSMAPGSMAPGPAASAAPVAAAPPPRAGIEVTAVPAPAAGPAPPPYPQAAPPVAPPVAAPADPPPAAANPDPLPAPSPQIAALPPARAGSLLFTWPVKGRVVSGFGPKPGGQHNDGINIEVARGSPVRAAEAGTVVYAGNELKGYGNLVLVRHAGGWVTAYAHNDEILVRRGAQIGKGHLIAKSGSSGGVGAPQVHFEIRKGREPVDPMRYLGAPEAISGAADRAGRPGPG